MASIVKTTHPEYDRMSARWKRCRDVVEGMDAVFAAKELYLPALKDQTTEDYRSYQLRANFVNYTWKTINALQGMLFRKEPEIEVGASIEPLLEDVTMSGISFHILAQQAAIEVLTSGRLGVLVDYPGQVTEGMTMADVQRFNLRPKMVTYAAESIINWKCSKINNSEKLSLIVLCEKVVIAGNEFEHNCETRYRVLDLIKRTDSKAGTEEYIYRQRVFRINDKDEDEQVGADLFPLMNNKFLSEIPFFFIGVDNTIPEMDEPPLIDLVDVNLAHYRTNADYAHGLHFTGLPTAVVSGYTPENIGDKLYVGSATAWVFPDPAAKATFLEFTGQGLGAIEKAIERMEQQMAILGARLLSSEKRTTETAQTAQIHRAGESSILSSIAQTISIGLTKALTIFSEWAGDTSEANIELNRTFTPEGMTPQMLTALCAAWQQGAISQEVLFDNLRAGEVIKSDIDFEDMQAQIDSAPPPKPEPKEDSVAMSAALSAATSNE